MSLKMSPFMMLNSSILILSSLMAISSANWFMTWAALEINLLSFIPVMLQSKSFQETEAAVKYFLVQAVGSSILLMFSMSQWFLSTLQTPATFIILLTLALTLKMGMAPCHMWYPSVMTSISWMAAMILSTWQKLAPLMIMAFLMYTSSSSWLISILAMMNAIIGGLVGLNQTHLRTLLAYSSITHMGWMLALIANNKPLMTMSYFVMYSVIIMPLFMLMHNSNLNNSSNMNKLMSSTPSIQFMIPLLLLSLSGIPPLTGFAPKWMTLTTVAETSPSLTIILIIGTMMNTYYYLTIMFNFMLNVKYTNMSTNSTTDKFTISMILATSSLFMFPLIMIMM